MKANVISHKERKTKTSFIIPSEHLDFINSNPSIDEYFTYLLPHLSNPIKSNADIYLISKYFSYFHDFYSIIKKQHPDKVNDVLLNLAKCITYQYFEYPNVIYQTGCSDNKFYIILKGTVDIIAPITKRRNVSVKEYYRYLAILIGFNENELLRKCLEDNYLVFPIEITCDNSDEFDILTYIKNNKFRTEEDIILNKKLTKIQLFDLLLHLSKPDIEIINEHGYIFIDLYKKKVIKGKHYVHFAYKCTAQEYISRYKQFALNDDIEDKSKNIEVCIYEYHIVKTLTRGNTFGEINTNSRSSIKTFTVITSNECHLCYLEQKNYHAILRDSFERNRKMYIIFILSTFIFKNFSIKLLQNHFFQHFITFHPKKGEMILQEGKSVNRIMLFKEGIYELNIELPFKLLTSVTKFYLDKIKHHLSKNEKIDYSQEIKNFLEEDKKIENHSKQIYPLYKFNNNKKPFQLFTMNVPDLFGFKNMNYVNEYNLFNIKCVSDYNEYMSIDWNTFYHMGQYDESIIHREEKFCVLTIKKIIKRLITIRKITLLSFVSQHQQLKNLLNLHNAPYANNIKNNEEHKLKEDIYEHNKQQHSKSPPFQKHKVDNEKLIQNNSEFKNSILHMNRSVPLFKKNTNHHISLNKKNHNMSSSMDFEIKRFLVSTVNPQIKEKFQQWLKNNKDNSTVPNEEDTSPLSNSTRIITNNELVSKLNEMILKNNTRRNERESLPILPTNRSISKSKVILPSNKKDESSNTMISSFDAQLSNNNSFINYYLPKEHFTIEEYHFKKNERYLNKRHQYLKESTRNIFLRNVSSLKFKARKPPSKQ